MINQLKWLNLCWTLQVWEFRAWITNISMFMFFSIFYHFKINELKYWLENGICFVNERKTFLIFTFFDCNIECDELRGNSNIVGILI